MLQVFDKRIERSEPHYFFSYRSVCHSFPLGNRKVAAKLFAMPDLVRVEPIALMPTQAGCAVFLGDGTKSIVFYIDPGVGASINMALSGQIPQRPLTHDLLLLALQSFGAKITRAVIVRMENEIYYARLIIEAENEIMERKIVELDTRPSDCLALVVRCGAPMYVVRELWDSLEDMTAVLREMKENANPKGPGDIDFGPGIF